jgi:D-3-phosphoglycerate dehydrogenase
MPKILITDGLDEAGIAILRSAVELDDRSGIAAQDLLSLVPAYEGLIVRGRTRITSDLLDSARQLRVVGRAGVGVDNIDLAAARSRGVTVVNAPQSTSIAVAELTFSLLLAIAREIPRADFAMKQGQWLKKELEGVELAGKTLGLIGFGRIGAEVGRRAAAFGMHVLAHDPLVPDEEIRGRSSEPASLARIYAGSDFISLHVPLDETTRGMLDEAAFAMMKPGVRLVCAARGGVVDEAALLGALERGKVAAAGLDVFAAEPPGLTPLISHPRVVATPHIGAQTREAQSRAAVDIVAEVLAALRGEPLRWKVA